MPQMLLSVDLMAMATGGACSHADILRNLLTDATSCFHLLPKLTGAGPERGPVPSAGVPFSRNNGLVLQACVLHWLRNFRTRQMTEEHTAMNGLWTSRRQLSVVWNGETVTVMSWPATMEAVLQRLMEVVWKQMVQVLGQIESGRRRRRRRHRRPPKTCTRSDRRDVGVQVDMSPSVRTDSRKRTKDGGEEAEAPASKRGRTVLSDAVACRHTPFRVLADICIRCTERVLFSAAAQWPMDLP
jgi:hypothetical protein